MKLIDETVLELVSEQTGSPDCVPCLASPPYQISPRLPGNPTLLRDGISETGWLVFEL